MKSALSSSFLFLAGGSLLLVSFSPDARALVNWKIPVDGAWSDPTKWAGSPPGVPPPDSDANFNGGTYTVTVDGNTIKNLSVGATLLTFNLAGNLTVSDTLFLGALTGLKASGTGTLNSSKIALNGGQFIIEAKVTTGDFMSNNGGTLLIRNAGSLTSGANTITTAGFLATVDGSGSKWTNTGLLTAGGLTITNGGSVTTGSAKLQGAWGMTAGSLEIGDLFANFGDSSIKQGSTIKSTNTMLNDTSTLDASTWDNSAGKFSKGIGNLTMTSQAQLKSQSAELSNGGGVVVKGDGTVWTNAQDLTVTNSSGPFFGLQLENGGLVTVGRDLLVGQTGYVSLNRVGSTGASRIDVAGKVDVNYGVVDVEKNGTITSKGVVGRAAYLTVGGAWSNTGNFVVGESSSIAGASANTLGVAGTLTTTADLILGKVVSQNTFYVANNGKVTAVNSVLAQGAGSETNAYIGDAGATSAEWTNSGSLIIADAGQAELTIDSGGSVTSAAAIVGNQAGSRGTVKVERGGKWTVNGDLIIGAAGTGTGIATVDSGGTLKVTGTTLTLGRDAGSTGSLTLASGGKPTVFDFSGDLQIGLAGSGTLNIARGFQLDRTAKSLILGGQDNSTGTLDVTDDGSIFRSKDLTIGSLGTGVLKIENKGSVQTTGTAVLGEMAGGKGMATLTGPGSEWLVTGNLVIGKSGSGSEDGSGSVAVADGATLSVQGSKIVLGQEPGSAGTLVVDGTDAKVNGAAALEIGRHGIGILQLQDHAAFTLGTTVLGAQSDGAGRITVAGTASGPRTKLNLTGDLTVGGASPGVTGSLLGASSKGGELLITGGAESIISGNLIIARDANSTGMVKLAGMGSTLQINGSGELIAGQDGTANFEISDHALFTGSSLVLGKNSGGNGTLKVIGSGGTNDSIVTFTNSVTVGDKGTASVEITGGGRLAATRVDLGAKGSVKVEGASSSLTATQSFNFSAGPRSAAGAQLTVTGGGVVTVGGNQQRAVLSGAAGGGYDIVVGGFGSQLFWNSSAFLLQLKSASAEISGGGTMTLADSLFVNGGSAKVSLDGVSSLKAGHFLFVEEGATLDIGAGASVSLGSSEASGLSLFDHANASVHDAGASLTTAGSIGVLAGSTLQVSQGAAVEAIETITIGAQGNATVSGAGSELSGATIRTSGSGGNLATQNGGHVTALFSVLVGAGTTVSTAAGGSMDIGLTPLDDAPDGQIRIGPFGSLKDNGFVTGNVVTLPGGKVGGGGTINGKLVNGGKAGPDDPQTLTVNGDYEQLAGAVLQIAIAGTASAAFDHLKVTGKTTLAPGSKLELDFIEGFAPKTGDVFNFLQTVGGMIGQFTDVVIHGLAAGFQYALHSDASGNVGFTALNDGTYVPGPDYNLVELAPVDSATGRTATLTLRLPANPPATTVYRVRASFDLLNWTTISTKTGSGPWSGPATITSGAPLGGFVGVSAAETLPLDSPDRFHRLEVDEM